MASPGAKLAMIWLIYCLSIRRWKGLWFFYHFHFAIYWNKWNNIWIFNVSAFGYIGQTQQTIVSSNSFWWFFIMQFLDSYTIVCSKLQIIQDVCCHCIEKRICLWWNYGISWHKNGISTIKIFLSCTKGKVDARLIFPEKTCIHLPIFFF